MKKSKKYILLNFRYNLVLDKELQIESLIENLPDGRNVAIEEPYAKGPEPMEAVAPVAPATPVAPAAPVPMAPKPVATAAPGYGVAQAPVLAAPAPVAVTGPASEVNFNIGPHGYRYLLAHGTAPALAPPVPKAAPVVVAPVAPAASVVPGALGTPIALPNGYLQKLLELNAQAIAEAKPIAPAAAAALLAAAYAPVPIPTAYTPVPAAYTSVPAVPAADAPVPAATAPVPVYAPAPAAYAPVPAVEPVSGVGPAVPQVHVVGPVDPNLPYNVVPHPLNPLYNGAPAVHYLGKRSAEATPEAAPEAWGKNPAFTWYGAPYDPLAGHLWLGQNPYLFHGPRYVYGAGYPLV